MIGLTEHLLHSDKSRELVRAGFKVTKLEADNRNSCLQSRWSSQYKVDVFEFEMHDYVGT